jgi:hypothetical protein
VWDDITGNVPSPLIVDAIAVDPVPVNGVQNLYIGTDSGAMVCTTCQGQGTISGVWAPLGTGLPNVRVDQLTLTNDAANIVAWTHGRGAWSIQAPVNSPRPGAVLDPTRVDFGAQPVNTTSAPRSVTLTNDGTAPLTITYITVNNGEFSETSLDCPMKPATLAPGLSCHVQIYFSPQGAANSDGAGPRSGELQVNDDAANSPQTASLSGLAWESLTGGMSGGPDASSWLSQGQVDVFIRGLDNSLWHRTWRNGLWIQWEGLGGRLSADPSAVAWGSGRIDVFVRGGDGALWHKAFSNGSWTSWQSLGGYLVGGPDAASSGINRLDVFVRGSDNALYRKTWNGTGWSGWQSMGGILSADPSAVSPAGGQLAVFVRGGDGRLYEKAFGGSGWTGWLYLGGPSSGPVQGAPDAASWGSGRIDLFARGNDNALYHRLFQSGWAAWQWMGGQWASDPGSAARQPGVLDVFEQGSGQVPYHAWFNG